MNKKFEQSIVLHAAESTVLLQLSLDYVAYLGSIEISNDGANATTAFSLQVQDHPNGEFYTVLSGSDFASLPDNDFLRFCTSNVPNSLASAAKSHIRINANGINAVRLTATSTLGTTVSVRGGFSIIEVH